VKKTPARNPIPSIIRLAEPRSSRSRYWQRRRTLELACSEIVHLAHSDLAHLPYEDEPAEHVVFAFLIAERFDERSLATYLQPRSEPKKWPLPP
jgi:hypothetical protein